MPKKTQKQSKTKKKNKEVNILLILHKEATSVEYTTHELSDILTASGKHCH